MIKSMTFPGRARKNKDYTKGDIEKAKGGKDNNGPAMRERRPSRKGGEGVFDNMDFQ